MDDQADDDQNPLVRINFVATQNLSRKKRRTTSVCDSIPAQERLVTNRFADHALESVRDRKAVEKESVKSPELKALTSKFLYFHLTSYACNLATIATSICYAMFVAERCL